MHHDRVILSHRDPLERQAEKRRLRREIRARRRALAPAWRIGASRAICERLAALWAERGRPPVAGFMGAGGEPDLAPFLDRILSEWGEVLLPRAEPESHGLEFRAVRSLQLLRPGFRGLLEPDPAFCPAVQSLPGNLLCLTPGLAFDESGGRLGQGGGYYDRLLGESRSIVAVGVCWSWQVLARVPCEPHDRRVQILADERSVRTARGTVLAP